jgi:hypothetical protein
MQASNVYLITTADIYETMEVELPAYENEDGTHKTFKEMYPNGRYDLAGVNVIFACIVRASTIPLLETWCNQQSITFGFGTTKNDVNYLDIQTAHEVMETKEWTSVD